MPDQMRGDCMSLEGHPVLQTPNIDRIGSEGVHFASAYTTCASCIAARRSLLTGQFPATNGMVGYREGIPIKVPTMPQLLKDAGYFTAIAGRYMHQSPRDEPYGFEKLVLGSTYIRDDDYAKYLEKHTPELNGIRGIGLSNNGRDAKPFPLDDELHATNWAVRQARKILAEEDSGRPLFLVASFYAPHPPLCPPRRYMERFLKMDLPHPVVGSWETVPPRESYENNVDANRVELKGEELRLAQSGYFGLIEQIDDLLANLVSEFIAKSEKDCRPWAVVFTSDHGEMLGDHHLFRKCEPYEGSSRIPFLIRGSPELGFASGTRCETPVCLEDIMPTLLDLAGIEAPGNIDGKSLVAILRGQEERVRDILHGEHATCYDAEQGYHFLTDGRIKYVWRPASGKEQLFDLEKDPGELEDLARHLERSADLNEWRERMIKQLKGRPEGFSDGDKLIASCKYGPVLPHALGEQRV
jgi:arylsulfatase